MRCRFYKTLWNSARVPHIYHHDVVEREAYAVLVQPGENLPGFDGSRVALGQIKPHERYLRVIYIPEPEINSAFVLTAFTLRGDILRACRARQRSKGKHHRGEQQRLQIYESAMRPWQDVDESPGAEQRFPPGWDEERVLRVIAYYERQTQDAQLAEDEETLRSGENQGG